MKRRGEWIEKLTQGMELPPEGLLKQPLVEISGEKRVLIENHRGVSQYGREQICVKVSYGQLSVRGNGLTLAQMTKEQLVICGRIDGVSLLRRGS